MSDLVKCVRCAAEHPAEHYRKQNMRNGPYKWCAKCRKENTASTRAGRDYDSRDAELKSIGFANYREYLKSDLWRAIRRKVYALKGRVCHLCPNQADALHHNRYHKNDLLGKKLDFIHPICNRCHERIEFQMENGRRKKGTLLDAKIGFKARLKAKKWKQIQKQKQGPPRPASVVDFNDPSPYDRPKTLHPWGDK